MIFKKKINWKTYYDEEVMIKNDKCNVPLDFCVFELNLFGGWGGVGRTGLLQLVLELSVSRVLPV